MGFFFLGGIAANPPNAHEALRLKRHLTGLRSRNRLSPSARQHRHLQAREIEVPGPGLVPPQSWTTAGSGAWRTSSGVGLLPKNGSSKLSRVCESAWPPCSGHPEARHPHMELPGPDSIQMGVQLSFLNLLRLFASSSELTREWSLACAWPHCWQLTHRAGSATHAFLLRLRRRLASSAPEFCMHEPRYAREPQT